MVAGDELAAVPAVAEGADVEFVQARERSVNVKRCDQCGALDELGIWWYGLTKQSHSDSPQPNSEDRHFCSTSCLVVWAQQREKEEQ